MRKSRLRTTKAVLSFLICICLVFPFTQSLYAYANGNGMGDLVFNERREIAQGVFLDSWLGKTPSGMPKRGYSITFDPKTSDAQVLTAYGTSVNSRATLSTMIKDAEAQGYMVIGGINGDFYNLNSGVSIGLMIQDGRLVSNNATQWSAIGFRQDGSVVIGTPGIEVKAILNESEFDIANFNKAQGDWGPYMYTSDFGPTTGSTEPSLEIVVDISMGAPELGNMIIGSVASVNSDAKATPIGENQVVLSARHGKNGEYVMSQLKVGDPVGFTFNDPEGKWDDVQQAIGGEKILLQNGQIPSGIPTGDVNPYTAIGVKANGEVVFLEVDGRKDTNSVGLSSMDAARFLKDQGCLDAISLDGGGSSTLAARLPGDVSPQVINSPSDGSERANSNGLLLVSRHAIRVNNREEKASLKLKQLHIYPGKTYILPGASVQLSAKATDEHFFPVGTPQEIQWQASGGTIQGNGQYIAPDKPGTYQITARSGEADGTATVVVISPNQITSIRPSAYSFSILPGTSQRIGLTAQMNNLPVISNNLQAQWKVEGNIGTITQDGVFTAAMNGDSQGEIKVTMGNQTASINVNMAQAPVAFEGFENDASWGSTGVRVASQKVSVVEDPDLAAFGSKLLKIDYDMTLAPGVENGVAGVYAYPVNPDGTGTGLTLENTPTAIGMWVYGDNSKTWLRTRVRDGNGETFDLNLTPDYRVDTQTGGIDWMGWKYVEAQIPAGKEGPYTLELPVRLMCSRDEMRTKGTLYIDQIRAVYGAKNDDLVPPTATITTPADEAVFQTGKVNFKAQITDNQALDKNSIRLYLDGGMVNGLKLSEISQGVQVEATLGSDTPLADGLHIARLRFTDEFGNNGSQRVAFTVSTGGPEVVASVGESTLAGGEFDYTLSVKNPNSLRKLYLNFAYDKDNVEVVDADPATPGIQAALEGWVKQGSIINNAVDVTNGRIMIEVDNLNAATNQPQLDAATIRLRTKGSISSGTDITLVMGAMIVGQNKGGSCFSLPDAEVDLEYNLMMRAEGMSKGSVTSITVTDREGNPVEGAAIYYNGMTEFPVMRTDKNGIARSDVFTDMAPGSVVTLQAGKDGLISNTIRFTVSETADGLVPQALNLSFDDNQSVLKFNYLTDPKQTGTIIQIVEKSRFNGSFQNATSLSGMDSESYVIDQTMPVTVRTHSVSVKDMKPGVAYIYRFKDDAGKVSEAYELIWPDTAKPYSFLFLTDPQAASASSYSVYGNALERAYHIADNPAFIVQGGDMVDRGNSKVQWDMFFEYSSSLFERLPVMAAPGNHETYDDPDLVNYRTYLGLPENGPAGFSETAYSFETHDALFMVINTQSSLKPQLDWMQQKAASSAKKWKIVVMHRGIYAGFYNEVELRSAIGPVMDKIGVDLVLNGHDHTYLRTTMKGGMKTTPGNGTTYITGGSSANKYYDAGTRAWTEVLFDDNKPVFTVLKVLPDRISVSSWHVDNGKTVEHDRFDIKK